MKLASIEHISKVTPIEGFDNIELISILNFKAFAKKGIFSKDTLCIFIRSDTNICHKSKSNIKVLSYEINNIYSDGIVLPLSIYPYEPSIGLDVTDFFDLVINI